MFNATMLSIAQKINTYEDWRITREQSLALMPDDVEEAMELLGFANKIRQRYKFRRVNKCVSVAVARDMCLEGGWHLTATAMSSRRFWTRRRLLNPG